MILTSRQPGDLAQSSRNELFMYVNVSGCHWWSDDEQTPASTFYCYLPVIPKVLF